MKQVYNNHVSWKCVGSQLEVSRKCVARKLNIKFFLNLLDSNTTNIFKDVFITPTEDIYKE